MQLCPFSVHCQIRHTKYKLLAHADDLLCLQQNTVGSSFRAVTFFIRLTFEFRSAVISYIVIILSFVKQHVSKVRPVFVKRVHGRE